MKEKEIKFKEKPKGKLFQDIEGKYFDNVKVIGYAGQLPDKSSWWWVECNCGLKRKIEAYRLKYNKQKKCNCEYKGKGLDDSPERIAYNNAKKRCNNIKDTHYKNYGGRGIEFRFKDFVEFFECLGEKPEPKKEYTIERIDVNGHYEGDNVKWIRAEQQYKNRTDNHKITFNEKVKIVADWAKEYGITGSVIHSRLKIGWCEPCAITIKPRQGTCKHKYERI